MIFALKIIIMFAGMGYTLAYFIPGILGDKKKLKKAGIIFIFSWVLLVLISVIEFYYFVYLL
jgi:Ca2+/Na+ antiporter